MLTLQWRQPTTSKRARDVRIHALKLAAERLGLGWGGVEKGGIVRIYFGDGLCKIRGLPSAESWMKVWKEWSDQGDMEWYWWNFAVWNYPREQVREAYTRLVAEGELELEVGS